MPATLPARPDLSFLKTRAKRLLSSLRKKKPTAKLAEAQLATAREYGFASWRKLKAHVDSVQSALPKGPEPAGEQIEALNTAISSGDEAIVRAMLARGPGLANARGVEGDTPLHHAAEHNRAGMVKLLMEFGADPQALYGKSAHTPLSWALTVGSFGAADALLEAGVKPDLFCAAGLGAVEAVKALFDQDGFAKSNASRTGSSRYAPDGSRVPRPPSDPVEVASDALYIACRNGQAQVVRYLLSQKVDLSFRAFMGGTPLHWAHFNGSREVIEMLLAAGADPEARDDVMRATPRAFGICVPAEWGIAPMVEQRLAQDPSLLTVNDARGTPLLEAARNGQAQTTRVLLEAGADINARDAEGKTPLDLARAKGAQEVIEMLETAEGASPSAKPQATTDTIRLTVAATRSKTRRTRAKVERNDTDVSANDRDGQTPLEVARAKNRSGIRSLLNRRGSPASKPRPRK